MGIGRKVGQSCETLIRIPRNSVKTRYWLASEIILIKTETCQTRDQAKLGNNPVKRVRPVEKKKTKKKQKRNATRLLLLLLLLLLLNDAAKIRRHAPIASGCVCVCVCVCVYLQGVSRYSHTHTHPVLFSFFLSFVLFFIFFADVFLSWLLSPVFESFFFTG